MARGVERRGGKLRVYFNYQGEKCREPLGLDDTPQNVQYAENLVAMVRHEISVGVFDYSKHFPNSKRLEEHTFGYYTRLWLQIKESKVSDLTLAGYQRWVRNYVGPKWGSRLIEKIDTIDIELWITEELRALSSKSIKECLQIMSQVFDLYGTRKRLSFNPVKPVTVKQPDKEDPDVFTREEMRLMMAQPSERDSELNMLAFWLWSGPRSAELMAMDWYMVDFEQRTVGYAMGCVAGQYKATKTRRSKRTVELLTPAFEALQRQYAITGNREPITVTMIERDNRTKREVTFRPVWINTGTKEPYVNIKIYRECWWMQHLKAAGVRYRGPSQCRHTFISQMLTIGMPINWIIAQVGHTTEAMVRDHYGKFIREDQPVSFAALADRQLGFGES